MRVENARWDGNFQSIPVPGDLEHRVLVNDIVVLWDFDGVPQRLEIKAGRRWDGASRPDAVGWLIPRFGIFSLASLVHDECFKKRPLIVVVAAPLSITGRMSRRHADMLFFRLAEKLSRLRTSGVQQKAQIAMAWTMWQAVHLFGEPTWDKHDTEFAA